MAISFVSVSSTTYASRTNTTVTAPASIQDDDILLLTQITATNGSPPTPTPPSGFSAIGSVINVISGSFQLDMRCYYKRAASESGSYTSTHSSTTSQGHIEVFRGVDWTTGPQDATSTANTGTGTTSTWTGLTTATNGAVIVAIGFDWADNSNNLTPPSGMTEVLDNVLSYVAYETIATAGATGNRSHTCNSNVGNPWGCRLIALKPAAAASAASLLIPPSPFRHMIVR